MSLRVQFPSDQPTYGPIGSIRYDNDKVNISGVKIYDNIVANGIRFSRADSIRDIMQAEAKEMEANRVRIAAANKVLKREFRGQLLLRYAQFTFSADWFAMT